MNKFMQIFLFFILGIASLSAAAHEYQNNNPFFYAVLAEAAYEKTQEKAQKSIDGLLGVGHATVLKLTRHVCAPFGTVTFILVKDSKGLFHVAIEGLHGIYQNGKIRLIYGTPVSVTTLGEMKSLINKYIHLHGPITTIVGHSLGGTFASQMVAEHEGKFQKVQVITFNGFRIKKGKNQLHLLINKEIEHGMKCDVAQCIELPLGGTNCKIKSDHGMKYFLNGLEDKKWNFILCYKK